MAITLSAAAAQSMATALATAIGTNSTIKVYSGTRPATPETAVTTQTLLFTATDATVTASGGTVTGSDPAAVTAVASGTAAWFRVSTSAGTAILDGTVGTSGADMNLSSTSIVAGGSDDLGAPTYTVPVS